MVKRVISFLFDKNDTEVINEAAARLKSMDGKVPVIRSLEVGIDEMHRDWSYSVVLSVTFDDKQALQEYVDNEYHVEYVGKYIRKHAKAINMVEYTL